MKWAKRLMRDLKPRGLVAITVTLTEQQVHTITPERKESMVRYQYRVLIYRGVTPLVEVITDEPPTGEDVWRAIDAQDRKGGAR